MSEVWWLSSTSKIQLMLSLLKSDLFLFFALILSHPIYFLYFIFFSPYLFKLLSFLSPLFITTSLFLLAFLSTTTIDEDDDNASSTTSTKVSFIFTAYRSVVERLRSKIDNTRDSELLCLEDFEVFRIVFDTPLMIHDKGCQIEVSDSALPPVFPCPKSLASELEVGNSGANELEQKLVVHTVLVMEDEKRLEAFLQELDEFDGNVEEEEEEEGEEKIEAAITKDNKVTEKQEEKCHLQLAVTKGSEAVEVEIGSDKGKQSNKTGAVEKNSDEENVDSEEKNMSSLSVESSRALEYINLGSYGSMRREKDWKRTLAGKLFEERQTNNNVNNHGGGSEGMDLLWETYETTEELSSKKTKNRKDTKEEKKNKNSNNKKCDQDMMKKYYPVKKKEQEKEEEEDEESDESDGQLCCLQALKFSTTGKMNMGMGRPSLVKISKAIKGFGWLHHVSSRHSKKVHIGDRF